MAMWRFRPSDEAAAAKLSEQLGLSLPFARVLAARGFSQPAQVRRLLEPRLADLEPAQNLPDCSAAVARIRQAFERQERILIWGHEDLDGITACVCLREIIADLRGQVDHYVPPRGVERHGLNPARVREFAAQGVRLVITVDCGVTNIAEIDEIQALGVDVVVTDHHEVLDTLPRARAVVDPKRPDSEYGFRDLAGVGVALKLGCALTKSVLGFSPQELFTAKPELLTYAALGSIADRVPLVAENRILVKYGLEQTRRTRLPAVQAVLAVAGIAPAAITVSRFVLELLPFFASADGNLGVEMLLGATQERATEWARNLWNQYQEWREEARRTMETAERFVEKSPGIVFVRSEQLSLRALGHCAARLKEQYLLPVCVIGRRGENWVGECRGVNGVNLVELLKANSQYLLDYGGHAKACGFTVPTDRVERFLTDARGYAAQNFDGRITETRTVVAEGCVGLHEVTPEFARLAPFGEGNPEPLLVALGTPLVRRGSRVVCPDAQQLTIVEDTASMALPGTYDLLYALDDNLTVLLRALEPRAGRQGG